MTRRLNDSAPVLALSLALAGLTTAHAQFAAGTVASYAGGSFTTGGVTYTFPTNDYAFSGTGVAPIPATAVNLRPDPNGANTILISCTNWSLAQSGESTSVDLFFQVTDANVQGGWQHSAVATGDGSVSESTTVEASPPAVSTSFQTATSGMDLGSAAWFSDVPQNVVVHITLSSGQTGTASLRSYGTHFGLQFPTLSMSIALKKPDSAQVSFVVPAGQILTLQSSPDLFDWSDLLTLTNTNSAGLATNYLDAIGLAPAQKFYRLRVP